MSSDIKPHPDVRLLIERAMVGYDDLPGIEQSHLMRGIAAVCPPESAEAETAAQIAFHFERLAGEQQHLKGLLSK